MIAKFREIFSFSVTQSKHKKRKGYNVEQVSCPIKEMMCQVHHSALNNNFITSEKYLTEKKYDHSIEALKSAFERTVKLMKHPCNNCASSFRLIIIESLDNIHQELKKKSTGFFGKKRYKRSYQKVDSILKEIKKEGFLQVNQIDNDKNKFLGNHLN